MKRVFVDMDGVLADFDGKILMLAPHATSKGAENWSHIVDLFEPAPGFYRDLKPIAGAVDGFRRLSEKYETYILSTASWSNPSSWTDKRLWVEEHLGESAYKRLILSHNKSLFSGRALIDDRTKNGADAFNGEHIVFGSEKYPDWEAVLKHLL
jgi:5'-nucleotidase